MLGALAGCVPGRDGDGSASYLLLTGGARHGQLSRGAFERADSPQASVLRNGVLCAAIFGFAVDSVGEWSRLCVVRACIVIPLAPNTLQSLINCA